MIPKPQSWGLINFIPFLNTDKTDKTLTNLYTTLRNNHWVNKSLRIKYGKFYILFTYV